MRELIVFLLALLLFGLAISAGPAFDNGSPTVHVDSDHAGESCGDTFRAMVDGEIGIVAALISGACDGGIDDQ